MNENQFIETIGSVTKYEHLCSLKTDIIPNTIVLRNTNPFPGVKNISEAQSVSLSSFFIILRYRYSPEKINRINTKLFCEFELKRHPSYGEIITNNRVYPCIRLKEMSIKNIIAIQEFLRLKDLKFMAYKEFDGQSQIKIFKNFKLIELGDGLYRDLQDGEKFYIRYKGILNKKRFDFIINKIRRHIDNPHFDAALGVIYRFRGPENVIRIYDHNKTLERAINLRKWFVTEIKKDIQIGAMY